MPSLVKDISTLPIFQEQSPFSLVVGILNLPMGNRHTAELVNCAGVTKSMTVRDNAPM